jgi:hypothetical protein
LWDTSWGLVEPVVTCHNCGFCLDADGRLLDWLTPEEIERQRTRDENGQA